MTLEPSVEQFIRRMPKVELHVHLKGSVRPETLLILADRNNVSLPATSVAEIREWYQFKSFEHFLSIFDIICECFCTPEDIELAAKELLAGQADQNIRYTEITYTATRRISIDEQMSALKHARRWANEKFGIDAQFVFDIPRGNGIETAMLVTQWAIDGMKDGIAALGLGGSEADYPPELYADCFAMAHEAGLPCVPHAGETVGPESIWSALKVANPPRIGHGVRCIEDPSLVAELCNRETILEVSPTSNVCLGVYDSIQNHSLPKLVDAGLRVTINSDDPPLFNTTLTNEYITITSAFGYDTAQVERFVMEALNASFLDSMQRAKLENEFKEEFNKLKLNLQP